MYHCVGTRQSSGEVVTPNAFAQQIEWLLKEGYEIIDLSDLVSFLKFKTTLSDKSVAITFDDGYQECFDYAVPFLKQHQLPATFFLVAGMIGKSAVWNSKSPDSAVPLMDVAAIRALQVDGFSLGSHSMSHLRLTDLAIDQAKKEIIESKHILENQFGIPITAFAYPYGAVNQTIRNLVEEAGYQSACSTQSGFISEQADLYSLRRIDVFGNDSLPLFRRKVAFGSNRVSTRDLWAYYLKRSCARVFWD